MDAISVSYRYRNPTENSLKFSPYCVYPHHSQTIGMDALAVLFLEIPNMQLHYDPMFDSLYIVSSCRFCVYFFGRRDFSVPLFYPAFDPSVPYSAIPLHMAHPTPPPPPATPATASPTSLAQVIPNISLSSESDPSEATDSPSSSSKPDVDYTSAGPGMANCFLME